MIASGNKPPAELPNRGKYMHEQDIVSRPVSRARALHCSAGAVS